ncbi:hypothetical protein CDAR_210681 [Caerostris darwini]|uniref:Uncharacterized protein n=1 Tax=Caerostris darwini TaxID=1538125 RepID=A0AAV4VSX2_9ARAC|nr:hypothetical protein CDAR_210681 [Caerostris darwini]
MSSREEIEVELEENISLKYSIICDSENVMEFGGRILDLERERNAYLCLILGKSLSIGCEIGSNVALCYGFDFGMSFREETEVELEEDISLKYSIICDSENVMEFGGRILGLERERNAYLGLIRGKSLSIGCEIGSNVALWSQE